MKKKQLWKVLGTGGLALSLLVSPMAGVSALAAETSPTEEGEGAAASTVKEGGSLKGLNPLQKAKEAVGDDESDPNYQPAVEAYSDTEIPVYGFVENTIVYSVDVEWGAMTFQYESSTWNPETHETEEGAGWRVYDSEANEALEETEHAINEIKVTNHSNAGVWAALTYAAKDDYTDTTGDFSFTTGTEDGDNNALTAKAGDVPAYLTLTTADNNLGENGAGKETVGKAYFMPDGISADNKTNGISKWTTIGTITVGIKTEEPTAAQPPVGP